MNDAGLSAQAASTGFGNTFSTLGGREGPVRQAFIMNNLGDQAGDQARTAQDRANAWCYLMERGRELATVMGDVLLPAGEVLLPVLGSEMNAARSVAGWSCCPPRRNRRHDVRAA